MATREQNDLYFGSPLFDQAPTLDNGHPWTDYDRCARCGHIRWNHAGGIDVNGSSACHTVNSKGRCPCIRFVTEWHG